MIFLEKKIQFKLTILDTHHDCEAEWVTTLTTQLPPIIRHKQKTVITNVDDISAYVESECPEPSLVPYDYDLIDIGSELFGAFFR
jgi:hypothetical protein